MVTVNYIIGGFNLATDLVILVLPIPLIVKLQLRIRQKLALGAVMATGVFVVLTTIIREIFLVTKLSQFDQAWGTVDDMLWLTIEFAIGVACGCLLVLRPLYSHVLDSSILPSSLQSWISSKSKQTASSAQAGLGNSTPESEIELGQSYRNGASSVETSKKDSGIVQTKSFDVQYYHENEHL